MEFRFGVWVFGVDPIEARKSGDDTYISTLSNELEREIVLLSNVFAVPMFMKSRNSESGGDDNTSGPIGFL
jgi:hypothetical protein